MFSEYYCFFYNGKCDVDVSSITDNANLYNNNNSSTDLKFDGNSNANRFENIINGFLKKVSLQIKFFI